MTRHHALLPLLYISLAAGCAQNPRPAPTSEFIYGIHIGMPEQVSVGVGAARVLSRQIDSMNHKVHDDRDVFMLAEPGVTGARVSLGYGFARTQVRETDLANVRLSAFRRWSGDSNRVYVGMEGSAVALEEFALGVRAGVFARVSGPSGGSRYLFALDFPIGW